jgi:hypothetical protein
MNFAHLATLGLLLATTSLLGCGDDAGTGTGGTGGASSTSGSSVQGSASGSTTSASSGGGEGGSSSSGGGSGDGGSGGSGGTGAGGDGAGGDGAGGGPTCTGDEAAWDAIQKTDIPCGAHADCCVVVNGCIAEAVVVGADDFEAAQEAWPSCESDCVDCFVPYLEVLCGESGFCEAWADDVELAPPAASQCGSDDPAPGNNGPGEAFDCSGAPM